MKRRALLSVSDKTGIIEFAKSLVDLGYEILSTGGTYKALADALVPVTSVSDVTGFPECLDGRVKTLHPNIHGGILAMRDNAEHMAQIEKLGISTIDIVAINLYPFKATIAKPDVSLEDAIENIDIGGPTMIRAAAKNYQDVCVVVDPVDYEKVIDALKGDGLSKDDKFRYALKVFQHTAAYDALISNYLADRLGETFPDSLTVTYEKVQDMRYGENPHQKGVFYREPLGTEGTLANAIKLHGKELSYNNINDANGALDVIKEFEQPCAVAIKHANPCGVAVADNILDAYKAAHDADPVSIFGGIVALNRPCDKATAMELCKIFLEIIIAPDFSDEALEILTQKKNIRLLKLENISTPNTSDRKDFKKVAGGLLVQDLNCELFTQELQVVTEKAPTEEELSALKFAFKVVKHTKSNGIVLADKNSTVGIGPGQTNRITALELAIKYAGDKASGSVLASDAFFPFRDCVDLAKKHGITAIIQPGGSVRDEESIAACNEAGIAMVFTGIRHFKH